MRQRTTNADRAGKRWRASAVLTGLLGSLGLLALSLGGVGGTYALWNARTALPETELVSGTAELSVSWQGDYDATAWTNLLPGESARRGFVLEDTGSTDLLVSVSAALDSSAFDVRVTPGVCAATGPITSQPTGATPTSFSSSPLRSGEIIEGCVEVRLREDAVPDDRVAFTLLFESRQVTR